MIISIMIIGICGFQSSGKDTISDYLVKEHHFIKMSFASTIKDILSIMFSWSREKLEGQTKEDRIWREQIDSWWSKTLDIPDFSPRYAMKYIGTDLFRNHFHQEIWIKIIENKILSSDKSQHIVISDCRFENEIDMIIKLGGKIIQVHRNIPDWFDSYKNGEYPIETHKIHRSELEWIRCFTDYEIKNDGTIEELYKKIENIINN